MKEYKTKFEVLKNDFSLTLNDKLNEEILLLAHKNGLSQIIDEAKTLSKNKELKKDKAYLEETFNLNW